MSVEQIRKSALDKFDKVFDATEQLQGDAPTFKKKEALLMQGAPLVDELIKMKNGVLTTIRIDLDPQTVAQRGQKVSHESNSIIEFRLLTAKEEQEILDYIEEAYPYAPSDIRYQRIQTALTLSYATRAYPDNKPKFTYKELLASLSANKWFALANKYAEFVEKYSPAIDTLSQEDLDNIIDALAKETDQAKKFDLLAGMSLMQTQDVLLKCIEKLQNVLIPVEQLCT